MNELWCYGVIGEGYEDSVTAKGLRDDLAKMRRTERVLVRVNSPGGDVFEAVAIHTLLAQWPGGVDVQVDGIAASAASYIATVGRTVTMARDAMQMIHDAWGITIGNSDDHRAASDVLDQVSENIVTAYVAKSGRSRAEIRAAMKAETWLTSDGAVGFGLADAKLGDDGKPVARKQSRATPSVAALQRRLDLAWAQVNR